MENQRITIGDLQRVLDILRGEELEVRFAAKLGINVTIVTSTDTHHFYPLFNVDYLFNRWKRHLGVQPLCQQERSRFFSPICAKMFFRYIF